MSEDGFTIVVRALVGIGIGIVLFLALREVFCWYWKINKAVDALDDMRTELRRISGSLDRLVNQQQLTVAPGEGVAGGHAISSRKDDPELEKLISKIKKDKESDSS